MAPLPCGAGRTREGLKQRYEHGMSVRAQHIKERVLQVAAGRRAQAVTDMQKLFGYAIELRPVGQLALPVLALLLLLPFLVSLLVPVALLVLALLLDQVGGV